MKNFFQNPRSYIFAFLVLCVASSKHIIIYNEELLILGIFIAFVIYVHSAFGESIKQQIDTFRDSILEELQSYAVLKKEGAQNIKSIQEKATSFYNSLESYKTYMYTYVSQIDNLSKGSINVSLTKELQYRVKQYCSLSDNYKLSNHSEISFLPVVLYKTQSPLEPSKQNQKLSPNKKTIRTAKNAISFFKNQNKNIIG